MIQRSLITCMLGMFFHESEVSKHMCTWFVFYDSEVSYHICLVCFFMIQKSPITCMLGLFFHGSEVSYHMCAWFVISGFRSFLKRVCFFSFFFLLLFFSSDICYRAYMLIPNFLTLAP